MISINQQTPTNANKMYSTNQSATGKSNTNILSDITSKFQEYIQTFSKTIDELCNEIPVKQTQIDQTLTSHTYIIDILDDTA
jgi:hypothetical protein